MHSISPPEARAPFTPSGVKGALASGGFCAMLETSKIVPIARRYASFPPGRLGCGSGRGGRGEGEEAKKRLLRILFDIV